jgi:acyl carrier protein
VSDTLDSVAATILEVLGEEGAPDQPIGLDTSFAQDLELESIELVALAEKLQALYGDRVDFVTWLSGKELDELVGLKVGDLVEHIDRCLSSSSKG